ncbi:MAG: methyltransferase domain-containing protein [Desulfuromonadaceae bacterium]|nr:methyltransferase domain-containing protein [Desulfuromonadaceae bacterium]
MGERFKDKVREQFGKSADSYIHNKGFATGDDLLAARELLQPMLDDNLLDIACGGGHTALFFAPLVRNVVASDLTMQMLKKAQEYVAEEGGVDNVTFREADAEDLPFPAGAFTLLTCRIAPHHFPDVPRALKEFHRVLRRDGRMVIIDTLMPEDPEIVEFYQTMEKMRDPTHIRAYTRDEWIKMIDDSGLILHETRIIPKTHDFPEWAARAGMKREATQQLNRFFAEAPIKIQDFFQIETFAGEVESYTDRKLLIYATRPGKK